jgi:hypothetical protein
MAVAHPLTVNTINAENITSLMLNSFFIIPPIMGFGF